MPSRSRPPSSSYPTSPRVAVSKSACISDETHRHAQSRESASVCVSHRPSSGGPSRPRGRPRGRPRCRPQPPRPPRPPRARCRRAPPRAEPREHALHHHPSRRPAEDAADDETMAMLSHSFVNTRCFPNPARSARKQPLLAVRESHVMDGSDPTRRNLRHNMAPRAAEPSDDGPGNWGGELAVAPRYDVFC